MTMLKLAKNLLARLARDEQGVTSVEYVILASVVGGVLFTGLTAFKTGLATAFEDLLDMM